MHEKKKIITKSSIGKMKFLKPMNYSHLSPKRARRLPPTVKRKKNGRKRSCNNRRNENKNTLTIGTW